MRAIDPKNVAPQPWETPFETFGNASVPVSGRELYNPTWKAQLRASPLGSGDGFYLWRDGDEAGFWALHNDSILESPSPHYVRFQGVHALTDGNIARVFFLDANGELRREGVSPASCLWIRADGIGGWNPAWNHFAHGQERFVLFQLNAGEEFYSFIRRRFDDVWHEFQSARRDPNSDVSFALRWADLSEVERENLLYRWAPRDQLIRKLELEQRLSDALLSDETLWQNDGADWVLNLETREGGALYRFENYLHREREAMSEFLSRAIETIWTRFDPFDELVLSHLCARRWKELNHRWFQGRVQTPTMHERLEGTLRFRTWLEERGA